MPRRIPLVGSESCVNMPVWRGNPCQVSTHLSCGTGGFLGFLLFWVCPSRASPSNQYCTPHSWIWYQVSPSPSPRQRLLHRAYLILQPPQPPPWLLSPKAPLSSPPPACTRWDRSAGGTQTNTTCPFLQVATLSLPGAAWGTWVFEPFFFLKWSLTGQWFLFSRYCAEPRIL